MSWAADTHGARATQIISKPIRRLCAMMFMLYFHQIHNSRKKSRATIVPKPFVNKDIVYFQSITVGIGLPNTLAIVSKKAPKCTISNTLVNNCFLVLYL
jgi:hypothetical protein